MGHGVTFDLTPKCRLRPDGLVGTQKLIVERRNIPLEFDGRKMYLSVRKPSEQESLTLNTYELTSPAPFNPEESILTRRDRKRKYNSYPGGLTMGTWRKRLALAPEDVIRKTFDATTQLCMPVEAKNRTVGIIHFKFRFTIHKEKRLNDVFHSDTFFPDANTAEGETCSQMFIGKKSDFMFVKPMKIESHSARALQDFSRTVGIPKGIKTDNAKTEIGAKWQDWCREF